MLICIETFSVAGVAGILTENPILIVNGVSTALSQFTKNDELLETASNKCREWGMEQRQIQTAVEESDADRLISQDNDLNSNILINDKKEAD